MCRAGKLFYCGAANISRKAKTAISGGEGVEEAFPRTPFSLTAENIAAKGVLVCVTAASVAGTASPSTGPSMATLSLAAGYARSRDIRREIRQDIKGQTLGINLHLGLAAARQPLSGNITGEVKAV